MRTKSTHFPLRAAIISADSAFADRGGLPPESRETVGDTSDLLHKAVMQPVFAIVRRIPRRAPGSMCLIPGLTHVGCRRSAAWFSRCVCGFFHVFFRLFDNSCLHFPETRLYYFSIPRFHSARWCNGSTSDSGSFSLGSSPGRAATSFLALSSTERFFFCLFDGF